MFNLVVSLVPKKHPELEASFAKLAADEKWILSGGKIVEDTLYKFSTQCITDHSVFSQTELKEIKEKDPLNFISQIPETLANYINKFNKNNTADLRKALGHLQWYRYIFRYIR
jgi:hypothetical protein